MNQKSLTLLWRITWTPISLLTLAILVVTSLILAMVMVRLCTRVASTLALKQFYVDIKKNDFKEKKRALTPPIWNSLVNLMAHIVCLAQKSIRSGVK